jgi:hypothetical protein
MRRHRDDVDPDALAPTNSMQSRFVAASLKRKMNMLPKSMMIQRSINTRNASSTRQASTMVWRGKMQMALGEVQLDQK